MILNFCVLKVNCSSFSEVVAILLPSCAAITCEFRTRRRRCCISFDGWTGSSLFDTVYQMVEFHCSILEVHGIFEQVNKMKSASFMFWTDTVKPIFYKWRKIKIKCHEFKLFLSFWLKQFVDFNEEGKKVERYLIHRLFFFFFGK